MAGRKYSNTYKKRQVGKTAVLDMNNRVYDAAIKDSTLESRGPYDEHSNRIIRHARKAQKIKRARKGKK